jgi:hypothetical protein
MQNQGGGGGGGYDGGSWWGGGDEEAGVVLLGDEGAEGGSVRWWRGWGCFCRGMKMLGWFFKVVKMLRVFLSPREQGMVQPPLQQLLPLHLWDEIQLLAHRRSVAHIWSWCWLLFIQMFQPNSLEHTSWDILSLKLLFCTTTNKTIYILLPVCPEV